MQLFVGARRTGKTWQLICLSHETGFPILARNQHAAKEIERQAWQIFAVKQLCR